MSSSELHQILDELAESIRAFELEKLVFSQRKVESSEIRRAELRPIKLKAGLAYQLTSFSQTQAFHKNFSADEAVDEVERLAMDEFLGLRATLRTEIIEIQPKGKGGVRVQRQSRAVAESSQNESSDSTLAITHNKPKNYLIPDETPCPFLIETGIMSKDGRVRASHMKKFRQINRFLEFIDDVADHLPGDRPIRIVDFGCGKSYLTFATHYLFTQILKRPCEIVGLDLREDVVQTCRRIQTKLKLDHLRFEIGNISDYQTTDVIDLVISLHACDTATDYAIFQAIQWNATAILAVPCCQHELNNVLPADAFEPITSFGLTKERFAALMTDSIRASLLSDVGYQTQLLEFIDLEHTPKNVLIRAVRKHDANRQKGRTRQDLHSGRLMANSRASNLPRLTLERLLDPPEAR